jgi:hypothetical protein
MTSPEDRIVSGPEGEPAASPAPDSRTTPVPEVSAPAVRVPAAEKRLATALRELHARGETVADDVLVLTRPPVRFIAMGIAGALVLGGVALIAARRRSRRTGSRRSPAPRSAVAGVMQKTLKDVATRLLLTGASAAAAHLMHEIVLPMLRERLLVEPAPRLEAALASTTHPTR